VISLALSEPAVIPSQEWYKLESTYWQKMKWVMSLPDHQIMDEFFHLEMR
jgi:hypothetical protein